VVLQLHSASVRAATDRGGLTERLLRFFNKNNAILGIFGRKFLLQNNILTITELEMINKFGYKNIYLAMITFQIKHIILRAILLYF